MDRLLQGMTRLRALTLPAQGVLALAVLLLDGAPWRRAVALGSMGLALASGAYELARARRRITGMWSPRVILAALAMQSLLMFASGGLSSPLLPLMVPVTVAIGFSNGGRGLGAAVGFQLATLAFFGACALASWPADLVPALLGQRRAPVELAATGTVMAALVVLLAVVGRRWRGVVDEMVTRAFVAHGDLAALYRHELKGLQALSAEIAHELKNPLASIKGLGALLARDIDSGRPGECLGVLRGEVDRMQAIVEEFLTFSRPLVPLDPSEADLAALCREVALVCEGQALERRVRIAVTAPHTLPLRCDPRKIMQVLVNLVQNALEASPEGATVRIRAAREPGTVSAAISDEGTGLSAEVKQRLFEPGVTSKATGSGLGLTIARALVRQHRGDLVLDDRPGGGCEALVRLPEGS